MAYAFGQFFICPDSTTARRLSENNNLDCITLDGDIYRSAGLVTGGAPPSIQKLIERTKEYKDFDIKIREAEKEAEKLKSELNVLNSDI